MQRRKYWDCRIYLLPINIAMTHSRVTCQKKICSEYSSHWFWSKKCLGCCKSWPGVIFQRAGQLSRISFNVQDSGASRANETQLAQSKTVPPVNSGFLLSKPSYGPPISFYSGFEKREVTIFQLLKLYKFCSKYAACYCVRLSESHWSWSLNSTTWIVQQHSIFTSLKSVNCFNSAPDFGVWHFTIYGKIGARPWSQSC